MRYKTIFAVFSVVLMLLLLALSVIFSAPVQAVDERTPTPTPQGIILFEDDFATYSGRWGEIDTPKASIAYRDGALMMRVVSPGVYTWSVPDFDATLHDYRVEVTATIQDGSSADSRVGFILDYQDDKHFYALLTTTQGEWVFLRRQGDELENLTPPESMPPDLMLETEDGVLRLRADVIGAEVTLAINDQPVGSVTAADAFSGAKFGLIARAGHGYVDVLFDDFVVTTGVGE